MKTVKILISILFLILLASVVVPVLAKDRLTFAYAVIGNINNMDKGVGASMFLSLKGSLNLGTPDFKSSDWSQWMDQDRGWQQYNGGREWWFSWNDQGIPQQLKDAGFIPEEGKQYRAQIQWSRSEHWRDHFQTYNYRWYTSQGSWNGELVAMWGGGTSSEKFSVTLVPWKVEKTLAQGNMYMVEDSFQHESWDIFWVNTGNGEQGVGHWEINIPIGGGFEYHSETLTVNFNGKIQSKTGRFQGWLRLDENSFSVIDPPSQGIGVSGSGEFGPYSLQFHP